MTPASVGASSAPSSPAAEGHTIGAGGDADWWRQAAVYQIYPRSFADSNGDGIGDLRGVTSRIGYLERLGVDAVWLSPFYPSALVDGGYDVDDYRAVDPSIGTIDDFDGLVTRLHHAGIRLMVDIVPNHTSNRHEWFREALESAPGSPARDRYVFRRGGGAAGDQPPSDWTSLFGGPAWEPVGDGDWYLHLFAREQPDLNWANDQVRADFLDTLRFWSDRGVDGFRVDVAHGLAKELADPMPTQSELDTGVLVDGAHPWQDRDEVHDIYREWRAVFDEYDPPRTAVAEVWVPDHRRIRYASPEGLGQAFNFDLITADCDAGELASVIQGNLELAAPSGASTTWVLSNHDVVRHASRYALPATTDLPRWLKSRGREPAPDTELGLRRGLAVTLLAMALPGSMYLYQGEELGLAEVADLPEESLQDPIWTRSAGKEKGRDGCRVPLPWTVDGPSFGFGDGPAHLPQPDWFSSHAVELQLADPDSALHLYSEALRMRRALETAETLTWLDAGPDVVAFRRPNGWCSITNLGANPMPMPPGRVLLISDPAAGPDQLPPNATAWLTDGEHDSHHNQFEETP